MIPQLKNISALETICLETPHNDTAVVMLHGYGASMNDLMPLWEMWHQPNFNWYFPNGVLALPMGYYEGRAWFPIDMAKLQEAINRGIPRDMAGSVCSTCALSNLENDDIIRKLHQKRPNKFQLIRPEFAFGEPTEFGWQVLPDNTGWGPFYLSVVKRTR